MQNNRFAQLDEVERRIYSAFVAAYDAKLIPFKLTPIVDFRRMEGKVRAGKRMVAWSKELSGCPDYDISKEVSLVCVGYELIMLFS